eukprot:EG_transcript_5535
MQVSVYAIYVLACLLACGAAGLSGFVLTNTFNKQQRASEDAQAKAGTGQVTAMQAVIQNQMTRLRSATDAIAREFFFQAAGVPSTAYAPDVVVATFNETIFKNWVPNIKATDQLNAYGLTFMYTNQTTGAVFDRTFWVYWDLLMSGRYEYAYATTSAADGLCHAQRTVWTDYAKPVLAEEMYSVDTTSVMRDLYYKDDYYVAAVPWSASDGNSYWYITHVRAFYQHGIWINFQSADTGMAWLGMMKSILTPGADFVAFSSEKYVLAATAPEEADRLATCRGTYINGVIPDVCINSPADQHPIRDIRDIYTALHTPQWDDLRAGPIPPTVTSLLLHGEKYMAISATLFSRNASRITIVWYQRWVQLEGDAVGLTSLIVFLTVFSTFLLTVLGVFGILRPLIQLGRSTRTVAHKLKYGDGAGGEKVVLQRSWFTEVRAIQTDFETIVLDFLGFNSVRKAAEQADTVLNHILKNTMADAAACIQLYAEGKAAQAAPDLTQAVTCLARGMQWCRKRHVLLRISEGDYRPSLQPVALRDFGEQLVRGRAVTHSFPDEVVLLDEVLCNILLDNALNNAFRHGNPFDPHVHFLMELAPLEDPAGSYSSASHQRLTFTVCNRADPSRPPVTQDLITAVLTGHPADDRGHVYRSALSEHLGLGHMFRVAEVHGMTLTLQQEYDTVVLRASLKV